MGNILANLCPRVSSKFISKYRRMDVDIRRGSSTDFLANDFDNVLPEGIQVNDQGHIPKRLKIAPEVGPKISKEHVQFPFLFDDEIAHWILNTRFMFILRGPPGSGKSYIAECIKLRYPSTKICSADDFWYLESDGMEYQFDPSRVAQAHQWCQNKAFEAASSSVSPIVIDNTNVRAWETRFYTDLARKFGYFVIMVTPQTPWRFDADALTFRNVHFVGYDTVESKVRNFEHVFPLYYGWLWPGPASELGCRSSSIRENGDSPPVDSFSPDWPLNETQNLLRWAWHAFVTIVGLPDVHVQLTSALSLPDHVPTSDLLQHWLSATEPAFGVGLQTSPAAAIPHITARFSRFGRAPGAEMYGLSSAVMENLLGRLFTVQVTGLFFSLRSVGIRIRLPGDELVLHHLWGSEDQAVIFPDESATDRVRPIGCRAHVTLALAADVPAMQTGLDLLMIVDSELNDQPGDHVAIIPGGSVRRLTVRQPPPTNSPTRGQTACFLTAPSGCEYMYVYDLDFPQHHRVLFSAVY